VIIMGLARSALSFGNSGVSEQQFTGSPTPTRHDTPHLLMLSLSGSMPFFPSPARLNREAKRPRRAMIRSDRRRTVYLLHEPPYQGQTVPRALGGFAEAHPIVTERQDRRAAGKHRSPNDTPIVPLSFGNACRSLLFPVRREIRASSGCVRQRSATCDRSPESVHRGCSDAAGPTHSGDRRALPNGLAKIRRL
jgi:hypothetical protein